MTGITASSEIKCFVKERLGCSCPDEVFSSIHISRHPDIFKELPVDCLLEIGGRLMVAICYPLNWHEVNESLERIIHVGVSYRDSNKLNRFRLVVPSADDEVVIAIQRAFDSLKELDDKTHIHFVDPDVLPDELVVSTN